MNISYKSRMLATKIANSISEPKWRIAKSNHLRRFEYGSCKMYASLSISQLMSTYWKKLQHQILIQKPKLEDTEKFGLWRTFLEKESEETFPNCCEYALKWLFNYRRLWVCEALTKLVMKMNWITRTSFDELLYKNKNIVIVLGQIILTWFASTDSFNNINWTLKFPWYHPNAKPYNRIGQTRETKAYY